MLLSHQRNVAQWITSCCFPHDVWTFILIRILLPIVVTALCLWWPQNCSVWCAPIWLHSVFTLTIIHGWRSSRIGMARQCDANSNSRYMDLWSLFPSVCGIGPVDIEVDFPISGRRCWPGPCRNGGILRLCLCCVFWFFSFSFLNRFGLEMKILFFCMMQYYTSTDDCVYGADRHRNLHTTVQHRRRIQDKWIIVWWGSSRSQCSWMRWSICWWNRLRHVTSQRVICGWSVSCTWWGALIVAMRGRWCVMFCFVGGALCIVLFWMDVVCLLACFWCKRFYLMWFGIDSDVLLCVVFGFYVMLLSYRRSFPKLWAKSSCASRIRTARPERWPISCCSSWHMREITLPTFSKSWWRGLVQRRHIWGLPPYWRCPALCMNALERIWQFKVCCQLVWNLMLNSWPQEK